MSEELHKHAERELLGDLLDDDVTPEKAEADLDAMRGQDTEERSEEAAQPDTDAETGQPDTEAETGSEDQQPDFSAEWQESELAKRYGSVAEAEKALREKEAYISRLANQIYNQPQQPAPKAPEPVTVDPDTFYQNPQEAIKRMGYVSREEAAQIASQSASQIIEEERVRQFLERAQDFNEVEPQMVSILDQYPGIRQLPKSQALNLLYKLAKADEPAPKPRVQVDKGDPSKKERAQTSGGRSAPTSSPKKATQRKPDEWLRLSEEQIEKEIGFSDSQ